MKLALGTVQFGMDYGITNSEGKTSFQEIESILRFSHEQGIVLLDTAPSYGDSEKVLGGNSLNDFDVITKTPYIKNEVIAKSDIEEIEEVFYQSLENLNVDSLYGLFVHQTKDMYKEGSDKLYEKMLDFKERGIVQKIGVSIYEKSEITDLFNRYKWDMVQIPVNVLDQRLIKDGTLSELSDKGIEIHARSIFLQGLLLTDSFKLESRFKSVNKYLAQYYNDLHLIGMTKIEGALNYINEISEIDYAVIGVNNLLQLKEILLAYKRINNDNSFRIDYSNYAVVNENIIDPRKWG
ncbi:aldo/keto reductase [Solibacillus sp. FSL H8-0538]|uniref:aldo/keto reductase n=1 Tax=Solibacillus sp. FSL H8-0538 TaxID=2921400 RepID=UPI0030F4DEDA